MTPEDRAKLSHDVGKYVARIARNVPPGGPFPAALGPLLIKDLYALPGGRASAVFDALCPSDQLDDVRAKLATLDELEEAVRALDSDACLRACALAREIDDALRAFAGAGA